jgi:transcription-repair coupling factor (superfamily II helicase)
LRNPQTEVLLSGLIHSSGFTGLAARVSASSPGNDILRLSGLTLTAKAVYVALLYRETKRPLILIADGNKQAEALYPLLRTFCDLLDAGTAPLLLPALDVLPGQGMSPHAEILATRAAAFDRLAHGKAGILVLPVAAALSRVSSPHYYRQLTLTLRVHEEIALDDLSAHLESIGYERRDPVEMVGEYSIRGGILDVFPPDQEQPVRIEFFGDEIESIRRFDPESQRSIHKLGECVLAPFTEFRKCATRACGRVSFPSMASLSRAGNCWSPPWSRRRLLSSIFLKNRS